jgi:hypoxanthine-DNA glycosylase
MKNIMSATLEFKTSFAPVADQSTKILILGSLPGDKSLELNQYYAHPRNRFWQVLAEITDSQWPNNYEDKIEMLRRNKIGVWDIILTAKRVGSLDTNILDEVPNDLDKFIVSHPRLEIIAFNGAKSQKLFDKYFGRKDGLKYIALPSTSPANASFSLEKLCKRWRVMIQL